MKFLRNPNWTSGTPRRRVTRTSYLAPLPLDFPAQLGSRAPNRGRAFQDRSPGLGSGPLYLAPQTARCSRAWYRSALLCQTLGGNNAPLCFDRHSWKRKAFKPGPRRPAFPQRNSTGLRTVWGGPGPFQRRDPQGWGIPAGALHAPPRPRHARLGNANFRPTPTPFSVAPRGLAPNYAPGWHPWTCKPLLGAPRAGRTRGNKSVRATGPPNTPGRKLPDTTPRRGETGARNLIRRGLPNAHGLHHGRP